MEAQTVLGVIPARMGSERLTGKPLRLLAGRPLIEWVWRKVSGFDALDDCVVATDAEEIAAFCRSIGARVVLTSRAHASGTLRVAEVVGLKAYRGYGVIVNVQGDEPFVRSVDVRAAVGEVRAGRDVGTVASPVGSLAAWRDPAVVKVTRRSDGAALYFSRAPIPFVRDREPTTEELAGPGFLRHIGVYAYAREALINWPRMPASRLEAVERLEQLRALEAGLSIGVALVEEAEGGVDTLEDLARAERRLMDGMEPGLLPIGER
ncbi:MAG: 3-deoxy-manno-octulosonate cytidylyltransferase [Longimicrobiales bacterium]